MSCEPIGETCKRVAAVIPVGIDLTHYCARRWKAGANVTVGDRYRPAENPSGFELEAINGGQTGLTEPETPVKLGKLIDDGSVRWRAVEPTAGGLVRTIDQAVWTSVPAGLNFGDQAITSALQQRATVYVSDGVAGETYLARCTVTFLPAGVDTFDVTVRVE